MPIPRFSTLLLAAGVGLAVYWLARAPVRKSYGSQTNAAEVDSPELGPDATPDEVLDAGVEFTFPASDPISVEGAYRLATRRQNAA
jgi:hypothetical protein